MAMNQYPPPGSPPPMNPNQAPMAQYGGHAPGYGPAYPQHGYEFDARENQAMSGAATWTMVLGVIYLLEAASGFLSGNILSVALDAVFGVLMIMASQAFKQIVTTQGQDVTHLMRALDKLTTLLRIRTVVLTVVGVLVFLAFALLIAVYLLLHDL